eukprot:Gb_21222 [translate_table: standard]
MVKARVPLEVRLIAPIWEHCGILSKFRIMATPGVVVRPIAAHISVLVVAGVLSDWTGLQSGVSCSLVMLHNSTVACIEVGRVGCATTSISSLGISLRMAGLYVDL